MYKFKAISQLLLRTGYVLFELYSSVCNGLYPDIRYVYNAGTHAWSQLSDSSVDGCALAIINNLLTLIGERIELSL